MTRRAGTPPHWSAHITGDDHGAEAILAAAELRAVAGVLAGMTTGLLAEFGRLIGWPGSVSEMADQLLRQSLAAQQDPPMDG
jgi:hypothetical protein